MPLAAKLNARVRRRSRLIAATAVGIVLAILTLYKVSLQPPFLHARALNVAAASTTLMIDTKHRASSDLGSERTRWRRCRSRRTWSARSW